MSKLTDLLEAKRDTGEELLEAAGGTPKSIKDVSPVWRRNLVKHIALAMVVYGIEMMVTEISGSADRYEPFEEQVSGFVGALKGKFPGFKFSAADHKRLTKDIVKAMEQEQRRISTRGGKVFG